jgi:hypothetical protein
MKFSSLAVAIGLATALSHPSAQEPAPKTLSGTLTIKSKNATVAVVGRNPDKTQGDFMFCISQDRTKPQTIDYTGPGKVIYRPRPLDLPPGVKVSGPEMVAPALAVVADDGKAWVFAKKGEPGILPANDPAAAKATRIDVVGLSRSDWAAEYGPRRGISVEGCLAPGGE